MFLSGYMCEEDFVREIDVGPSLFTLLQPEMLTDGARYGISGVINPSLAGVVVVTSLLLESVMQDRVSEVF